MVDSFGVEEAGRDDLIDDLFFQAFSHVFVGDIFGVLHRDDHGVHSDRDDGAVHDFVFDGDLGLGVSSWNTVDNT